MGFADCTYLQVVLVQQLIAAPAGFVGASQQNDYRCCHHFTASTLWSSTSTGALVHVHVCTCVE